MKAMICLAAATACLGIASATASAQDFQKSYEVRPGGRISVSSMSGNVVVTGYDGREVLVTATKRGDDVDRVTIEDRSGAGEVDVTVKYPKNCNCNVSVDFEVRVPQGTAYTFDKIASMSGDVEISGVSGRINVTSMSGNVSVRDVSGTVEATAMSGDVAVQIDRLAGDGDMSFTAMSGDVEVRLPSDADADVSLSTLSGSISTDFAIPVVEQKYGPGQSARGTLGAGSRAIKIKSMSGNARLLRN